MVAAIQLDTNIVSYHLAGQLQTYKFIKERTFTLIDDYYYARKRVSLQKLYLYTFYNILKTLRTQSSRY